MNTNKYLAYTSLCQTNTELWKNFNIDRAIVVDDIEYNIPDQKVRYIYTESPDDKKQMKYLQEEIERCNEQLNKQKSWKNVIFKIVERHYGKIYRN